MPLKPVHVAVVGVGLVGTELVEQIAKLATAAPRAVHVIYMSSSSRVLYDSRFAPLDLSVWRQQFTQASAAPQIYVLPTVLKSAASGGKRVVLVDCTSSDDIAAKYPDFLNVGIHVVTPNKKAFSGSLALYDEIAGASRATGAKFLNEATVGAGLPIIGTLKDLIATGDKVLKIEGVLSGTLSYIFNEFSTTTGSAGSFSSIVKAAKQKGYTEPHPAEDLSGFDVSRKLTILSRLIPSLRSALPNGFRSVATTSLVPEPLKFVPGSEEFMRRLPDHDAHFEKLRAEAFEEGMVLRFVGVIDVEKREIKAGLEKYPFSHPFATSLSGSDNIIAFHTERYSPRPLIIQGAGAGAAVTAMGVLSDILKV
ncbi:hypothetical protein BOTBODRAFT_179277 [Botryobasidium botryosum FD-172 SS1]|uniref:Homoserine dehydrogenase n=1 Tax=Botryobasidium botryosum (strain FD-172 SS1) TaxID=930990 RepID=A0A067M308_BOTB1|nr:hypothetical protein BOTBODRAFT_179277 [Botryobasidium botryosum FD-172 SS1]